MARNSSGERIQGEPLGQRQGACNARKSCDERVQGEPLGQRQGARKARARTYIISLKF